jgi:predicted RNA-binding protein (virulence factor B family)
MTESEARKLEIGDLILCIDDEHSFNHLQKGSTYRVDSKLDYAIGIMGRMYSPERFEKINKNNY